MPLRDFKTSADDFDEPVPSAALRRAVARLTRRREMRDLSRRVRRRGERAWVVGGAARDLILGRPVVEVDIALEGDVEGIASEMERAGLGRSVRISSSAPRVFRVAGRRDLDLAELEGKTIEQDLARRDFTVNAIALEIPAVRWIDPFRGIGDLVALRLRVVRSENLREDPARVFRAARLIATLGLRPDPATSRACRDAAPALSQVAPERLRVELTKLLESERVVAALTWAASVGALAPALGTTPAAAGRLRRRLGLLDRVSVRSLEPRNRGRVRLALIAGGLGLSPPESSRWLLSRRFSREEAGETAALLELVRRARAADSDEQQWAWVRDAAGNAGNALLLVGLLVAGSGSRARTLRRRWKQARRGPRVRGSDVMDWLGLAPGPRVGELLRELEVEILRGAVRSRGEARRWLSERLRRD